jgi:hypothetical protein
MPVTTFLVRSVSKPERRQNKHTKLWFKVWTIDRQPDDSLAIGESLAGYETSNAWHASLCDQARLQQFPVTVLWKDSPWLRSIIEVTLAHKESAA